MIKWWLFFIGIIFSLLILPNISAIIITEIELNPTGTDAGNEWIELYSENEINLEGYKIINNDGKEINLSGSFLGYYAYISSKQWLDNEDEKVFLYKGSELVDETDLLKDSWNDGRTWQLCNLWESKEQTKGKENNCTKEVVKEEKVVEEEKQEKVDVEDKTDLKEESSDKNINDEELLIEENGEKQEKNIENISLGVIKLNSKSIKSVNDNKNSDKNSYALGSFIIFCILLAILFIIKKGKKK